MEKKMHRKWSKTKLFYLTWMAIWIVFIYYTEHYLYKAKTLKWSKLECQDPKLCTKILLVGDPQIIGNYREHYRQYITPFSIYDSDRYLFKTYSEAFDFTQPDLVIFLGDLMDEGSAATDPEFYNYVRRIFKIFLYNNKSKVRHIWLPGDNDIGGEDFDVKPRKLRRFDRAFSQPDTIIHKNMTFFKINRMTQSVPIYKKPREFYDTKNLFIGLSHLPLMFMPSPFVERVISKMLPQLLFTAHEHKAMIFSTDALLRDDFYIVPVSPDNNQVFEYTLGVTDMYEIVIPTCSYRMGTKHIGYGYAIIERNELKFTVLWTPSRFDQLKKYFMLFVAFLASQFMFMLIRRRR